MSPDDADFSPAEVAELRELLETSRIQAVMSRYVRGNDRGDLDLMRSAYWEDSFDDHGTFVGPGHAFVDYRGGVGTSTHSGTTGLHHLTSPVNVLQIDGGTARVETYFHFVRTASSGGLDILQHLSGRYRDLFEQRAGEWRILRRKVIYDWCSVGTHSPGWEYSRVPGANVGRFTPEDDSYDRDW